MYLRLAVLASMTTALYAALSALSDASSLWSLSSMSPGYQPAFFEQSVPFFALFVALLIPYAFAVRAVSRSRGRALFVLIFLSSALFRAVVFFGAAFEHPEPELFLQGATPLSAFVHHAGWNLQTVRGITTVADLAALALAPSLLRAAGLPVGAAVIHGWNPLVVVEVAGKGRIEAIALLFLVATFKLMGKPRLRWAAALSYGASLSGATILVAALPAMAKRLRLWVVPAVAIVWTAWRVGFPETSWAQRAGWPPGDFFGGSLTPALVALAQLFVTRNVLAVIGAALFAWLGLAILVSARKSDDAPALPKETLLLLGSFLLVSPQVAPWTFLAVAYLAAYTTNRGWIVFTATAPLTYLALSGGSFSFWLGFAQYFAAYAALIFFWLGGPPPDRTRGGLAGVRV